MSESKKVVNVERKQKQLFLNKADKINKLVNLPYQLIEMGREWKITFFMVGLFDRLYKGIKIENQGQMLNVYTVAGALFKSKAMGIALTEEQQAKITEHFDVPVIQKEEVFHIADSPLVLFLPTQWNNMAVFVDANLSPYECYKVVSPYQMVMSLHEFYEHKQHREAKEKDKQVLPWMSSMFSAGALNQLPWSVWIKN
jgi:hypothetical protein